MKEKHSFQIWWESIVGGGKSDGTPEREIRWDGKPLTYEYLLEIIDEKWNAGYLQGLKEATELEDNLKEEI